MRYLIIAIGLLIVTLLVSGCGQQEKPTSERPKPVSEAEVVIATDSAMIDTVRSQPPSLGEVAPDFSYTLPDGSRQKLSDLRGKKVVLNFWATWCGPCQDELPELQRLSQEAADDDLVVLAINRQEIPDVIQPFAAQYGITFPIVVNLSNDIGDAYGIRGLPTTYFMNTDGTINSRQIGAVPSEVITARIQELQ